MPGRVGSFSRLTERRVRMRRPRLPDTQQKCAMRDLCACVSGDADGFRCRQSNTKRQTGLLSPRSVGVVTLRRRQDFLPFFSTLPFPRQHVGEGAGGGYHRVAFLGDRRVTSVGQGGWERRRWGGRGSPSFSRASVDHKLPGTDFYEGPNKSRAVDSM